MEPKAPMKRQNEGDTRDVRIVSSANVDGGLRMRTQCVQNVNARCGMAKRMGISGKSNRPECLGSGPKTASEHERHVLGFVRCSSCGRVFKVRYPNRETVTIPRHKEPPTLAEIFHS